MSWATLGQPRALNPGATKRGGCFSTAVTNTRSAVSSAGDSLNNATFTAASSRPGVAMWNTEAQRPLQAPASFLVGHAA
jgi:hypothetical protein